jgi:hypothetical protein
MPIVPLEGEELSSGPVCVWKASFAKLTGESSSNAAYPSQ